MEMGILIFMIVTATELANDSQKVLDRVIERGEVAEIRPKVGTSRRELERILQQIHWTEGESRELRQAMDTASEVLGYAGGD